MVQMFNVGPSRKDVRRELLGSALGKSLAEVGNTYFANKALEKVIADPEMDEASPYERSSKLEQAMRPFGDKGKQLVEERMGLEQKYAQEQEGKLINKLRQGIPLTDRESKQIRPEVQLAFQKANKPTGATTSQPVPQEIAQAIPVLLNQNKEATADELASVFDSAGIPRLFSNSYIENRRRQDEAKSKTVEKQTENKLARDEIIIKDVNESRKLMPIKKASTETMKNALMNNDLSFFSLDNLAMQPGFEWAKTSGGASFQAAQKNHLISTIGQLTGRPNQWIEQQMAEAYAKIGRPQDANMASMAVTEFEGDAIEEWNKIVDQLEESGNYPPGKLGSIASKKLEQWYSQNIKKLNKKIEDISKGKVTPEEFAAPEGTVVLYAPDGGILNVKPEEVDYYMGLGAKKKNATK